MSDITKQYYEDENYVKLTVKQNYKDISELNHDLRWQYDNRIAVAGFGMLNPECDRFFKINGGLIGQTDYTNYSIRNGQGIDTGDYRYVKYAGADCWIK